MTKVTDLRREIKERLEVKNITDLTEMKLKQVPVGRGARSPKTTISSLKRMTLKIGKTLINPIINSDISIDDKLRNIEEIVNVGDFKLTIEVLNEVDADSVGAIDILKAVAKGGAADDVFLKVTISDKTNEGFTYSWLNFDAKVTNEGSYSFRNRRAKSYHIMALGRIVGSIYLMNAINKYYKNNLEMANITILKYAEKMGYYRDEEQYEYLQERMKSLGIMSLEKEKTFLNDSNYTDEYIEKSKILKHLEWLDSREFLSIDFAYDLLRGECLLSSFTNSNLIGFFANFLIELNKEEENDVKMSRSLSTDYAKSFETKKNIPDKIKEKMENTLFLNHFGYVEFDELVDLEKIEQIENEWVEINKKIQFPVSKGHSLRFRRLGNHNANGLYFPGERAVCVDIRSPKSMVHEVLHMIDHQGIEPLSSQYSFRGIIELYREITDAAVCELDDSNELKVRWKGSSKYNKSYYHNSKEIFARCGEIYIKRILGIDNSLVGGEDMNNILYPKNEILELLIENYYGSIIKTFDSF